MKIHHIRNATLLLETGQHGILVDPMLGEKGSLPPFSFVRFARRSNPIVELPPETKQLLTKVTHCLITHSQTFQFKPLQHSDHLDQKGEKFLVEHDIEVTTIKKDAEYLRKYGMKVVNELEYWNTHDFLGGSITAIPAKHGHGWNHHLMANGAGFFLDLPGEPSLYISGDTVLTGDVEKALNQFQPDIAVAAAGTAQLDIGPPILMKIDELLGFAAKAPKKVVFNHLEALNHCPTTRTQLKESLANSGLLGKSLIPEDGETMSFEREK